MAGDADSGYVTALQEEIRRAGSITGCARRLVVILPPLLLGAYAFWYFFWDSSGRNPDPHPLLRCLEFGNLASAAIIGSLTGAPVLVASIPVGFLTAVVYRGLARRRALRSLAATATEDRGPILLAMRPALQGDARRIVDSLLREASMSAEVAPALAQQIPGTEPAPAELL